MYTCLRERKPNRKPKARTLESSVQSKSTTGCLCFCDSGACRLYWWALILFFLFFYFFQLNWTFQIMHCFFFFLSYLCGSWDWLAIERVENWDGSSGIEGGQIGRWRMRLWMRDCIYVPTFALSHPKNITKILWA